jgi:hypothetical protein
LSFGHLAAEVAFALLIVFLRSQQFAEVEAAAGDLPRPAEGKEAVLTAEGVGEESLGEVDLLDLVAAVVDAGCEVDHLLDLAGVGAAVEIAGLGEADVVASEAAVVAKVDASAHLWAAHP